tara:strand:- start:229555 stop:230058 length:504 start_codon:yes stop_codon:yes gene_type:complete
MLKLRFYLLFIVVILVNHSAYSSDFISKDNLIGKGRMDYFFWHVYDVNLYAEDTFSFNKPFALSLEYRLNLNGVEIAEKSIAEIKKIGFDDKEKLEQWREEMRKIFPNVTDSDILTGIYNPNKPTKFLKNNQEIGVVEDPEFGKWFFGIWLSEKTSQPRLRKVLLGG